MTSNKNEDESNKSISQQQLREDQKQFRKLRKLLRQIEHLELLTRQLNEEEEAKVDKRDEYRARLVEITRAYQNGELMELIDENNDVTSSSIAEVVEETNVCDLADIEESRDYVDKDTLDELADQFENLGRGKEVSQVLGVSNDETESSKPLDEAQFTKKTKKSKKNACANKELKSNEECEQTARVEKVVDETSSLLKDEKNETKQKKKKTLAKNLVYFDAHNQRSIHVDLITTVDVCLESQLIVTGRYA